jgi:hypothetical protein
VDEDDMFMAHHNDSHEKEESTDKSLSFMRNDNIAGDFRLRHTGFAFSEPTGVDLTLNTVWM